MFTYGFPDDAISGYVGVQSFVRDRSPRSGPHPAKTRWGTMIAGSRPGLFHGDNATKASTSTLFHDVSAPSTIERTSLIAVHTDSLPSRDAAKPSGTLQRWVSVIGFPSYPSV